MDASDNVIFCVEGPVCMCQGPCCTQDMDFNVCIKVSQNAVSGNSKGAQVLCIYITYFQNLLANKLMFYAQF